MQIINHSSSDDRFLLPYQRRWVSDTSRLKLIEKSRQIGMTWTAAYESVRTTCGRGQRCDYWIASRDELQGRLFIEDCARWAKVFHKAARQ